MNPFNIPPQALAAMKAPQPEPEPGPRSKRGPRLAARKPLELAHVSLWPRLVVGLARLAVKGQAYSRSDFVMMAWRACPELGLPGYDHPDSKRIEATLYRRPQGLVAQGFVERGPKKGTLVVTWKTFEFAQREAREGGPAGRSEGVSAKGA